VGASFEWSSSDAKVVTVGKTDGVVTALSAGSANISVTSGAFTMTAAVSVIPLAAYSFTRTSLSADGKWTSDVLSYSPVDGATRSLPRASEFPSVTAPAWSNDGSRLAVEVIHSYVNPPRTQWTDFSSDLYVIGGDDATGSSWQALTTDALSRSPRWSPDGKRIAYLHQSARLVSSNDIYIVDAGGGVPLRVTATSGDYDRPSWSPDGKRLVFTKWGPETGALFTVNADGSALTRLTYGDSFDFDPSWSPDGKHIALISSRESTVSQFRFDVFVMNADGSNAKRLTTLQDDSRTPEWSSDGRLIMFSSGGSLYVMTAEGTSLLRLTTDSFDSAPAWRR
jgi:TolB protein